MNVAAAIRDSPFVEPELRKFVALTSTVLCTGLACFSIKIIGGWGGEAFCIV